MILVVAALPPRIIPSARVREKVCSFRNRRPRRQRCHQGAHRAPRIWVVFRDSEETVEFVGWQHETNQHHELQEPPVVISCRWERIFRWPRTCGVDREIHHVLQMSAAIVSKMLSATPRPILGTECGFLKNLDIYWTGIGRFLPVGSSWADSAPTRGP